MESSPFGNPEFTEPESGIRNPQCGIHSVESTVWNPESKTVMDSVTWGDYYMAS